MNMKFFFCACFCVCVNFSLSSKSLMPGLDRMREKVKKAVEGTSKISFKDYLKGGKDGEDAPKAESDLSLIIKNLYWCKQSDLIKKLEAKKGQKNEPVVLLSAEIDKKYVGNKSPFLQFAGDIVAEKASIEASVTMAMKNMQTSKGKDEFNQLMVFKADISRLIELVENLLKL